MRSGKTGKKLTALLLSAVMLMSSASYASADAFTTESSQSESSEIITEESAGEEAAQAEDGSETEIVSEQVSEGEDPEETSQEESTPDEASPDAPQVITLHFHLNGGTPGTLSDADYAAGYCDADQVAYSEEETTADEDCRSTWEKDGQVYTRTVSPDDQVFYVTGDDENEKDKLWWSDPTREGYVFDGWYSDASLSEDSRVDSSAYPDSFTMEDTTNGIVCYYAKWTPIQYTIAFKANGASSGTMAKQSLSYDQESQPLTNAFTAPKGYHFGGWNTKADGSGTQYSNKAQVKNLSSVDGSTVTLYAQWTINTYTILYELRGGVQNSANPERYNIKSDTIVFAAPTRKDCVFLGWYSDQGFTKKITSIPSGSTGSKRIFAKWRRALYTIKFMGNGAESGSMTSLTNRKSGLSYTLTANAFTRKGYKFAGWNTKADGSGTSYSNEEVVTLTVKDGGTKKLYAQWKPRTYTILYDLWGGVQNSANPEKYTIESGTITLADPTRSNCVFMGWYSDASFKYRVTEIPAGTTGGKQLYAKWRRATYNVKFYGNGATSGSMAVQGFKCGKTTALEKNAFTRSGYEFIGWNTKADGSGTSFTNQEKILNLSSKDGTTKKLYAQWKIVHYTINYDLCLGEQNPENPTSYTVEDETITLAAPTKSHHVFQGWYADLNLTQPVTEITTGSTGNKTLYSKWRRYAYTVKFYGNGATSGVSKKQKCEYGLHYTLTTNDFTRNGYNFIGWNTQADGSGTSYTDAEAIYNLADTDGAVIKLYAQWEIVTYSIDYDLDIGSAGDEEYVDDYQVISETIELPTPDAPEHYIFVGWYTDEALTNQITEIPTGSYGDLILYAKFRLVRGKILFDGNGATSGSTNYEYFYYGVPRNIRKNGFVRTNYTFTGWNTKADGSGTTYMPGDSYTTTKFKTPEEDGGVIRTLYAQWKRTTYSITYVMNGGTNNSSNPTSYKKGQTITLKDPSRSDGEYYFVGWFADADYTERVSEISSAETGNKTFYAKWLKYYCQYDAPYINAAYGNSAFGPSGCGPTSCAIVTGEDPLTVADYMVSTGNGGNGATGWGGITSYLVSRGKTVTQTWYKHWLENMKTGKYIGILLMKSGSYTNNTHYVVVTKVDDAGNCYVIDPAYRPRSGWNYDHQNGDEGDCAVALPIDAATFASQVYDTYPISWLISVK